MPSLGRAAGVLSTQIGHADRLLDQAIPAAQPAWAFPIPEPAEIQRAPCVGIGPDCNRFGEGAGTPVSMAVACRLSAGRGKATMGHRDHMRLNGQG